MRTLILLEVEHDKPIEHLATKLAGRAYNIQGVTNAEGSVFRMPLSQNDRELAQYGFSADEIAIANRLAGRG